MTQGSRKRGGEQIEQRAEIRVRDADLEHRRAAVAVERLHHHLAMLGAERLDRRPIAGDQRRRHQLGKIHHEQLFRRVAHAARIVDDQRLRDGCAREDGWWST